MDDHTKLKFLSVAGIAFIAEKQAVLETQTIAQMLVAKGICTADELKEMRKRVEANSERVKKIDNLINDNFYETLRVLNRIDETTKFAKLFSGILDGEPVSDEERKFMMQMLYGSDTNKEDNEDD